MRRRGHIEQAGEGRWRIRLSVGSGRARQRPHYTVYGTRADAERELTRLLHEMDTGTWTPPRHLTVGNLVELWLQRHAEVRLAPTTVEVYRSFVRRHICGTPLEGVRVERLTGVTVERHLDYLRQSGLSLSTVRVVRSILHRAFADALRWGLVGKNPVEGLSLPQPARRHVDIYSPEEIGAYLAATKDHPGNIALALCAYAGLRVGEACGLRWPDVDLEGGIITVRASLARIKGPKHLLKETKTGKTRQTPIIAPLKELLLEQRSRQAVWKMQCSSYDPTGWVASWQDGSFLSPALLSELHARSVRKAGLRHIRLHDLRHTCATLLLEAGVDIAMVSRWLGHTSVQITADIYSHVTGRLLDDAARKLERRLEG